MCGRFTVAVTADELVEEFGTIEPPFDIHPRFNIAPTQIAPVLLRSDDGGLKLRGYRWGLLPPWVSDESSGSRMINARAESLAQKPAFRDAFERRRCLVPADGWFEWRRQGKLKIPMWIHLRSRRPFAFAGLWERWRSGPAAEWVRSFTIVTTEAAPAVRHIHDRMPVLLSTAQRLRWLDPATPLPELAELARPYAGDDLEAWAVSRLVNSPENDVPQCLEPVPDEEPPRTTVIQESLL